MGDLLRCDVVDGSGRRVGRVHDLRLVQDGPALGRFGPALRVEGLVVGRGSLAIRLGYHRAEVRGPGALGWLFRTLEGRARYVPWERVAERSEGLLRLSCPRDELPRVSDVG